MGSVEQQLAGVLGAWAAGSLAVGAVLARSPRHRGFARQTLAWGAVDGLIAAYGVASRARRGPTEPARLRRVLLANAALDVGYLAVAGWLVRDGRWRTDGWAVAVQGGFLLVLDTTAAAAIRS